MEAHSKSTKRHLPFGITHVTCHPTQVNAPRLNSKQIGRYLIYLPRRDGRLSWPRRLVSGYIPRWFTCSQAVTHPSNNPARRRVTSLIGWNALPLRHATLPNRSWLTVALYVDRPYFCRIRCFVAHAVTLLLQMSQQRRTVRVARRIDALWSQPARRRPAYIGHPTMSVHTQRHQPHFTLTTTAKLTKPKIAYSLSPSFQMQRNIA